MRPSPTPVFMSHKHRCTTVQGMYETGWALGRIVRATKVSIPLIQKWAVRYQWARPVVSPSRTRYTPEERHEVVTAVQEGVTSIAELSRQTEIHRRTIGRWVHSIAPEDVAPAHWRCRRCNEYGTPVTGPTCQVCGGTRLG